MKKQRNEQRKGRMDGKMPKLAERTKVKKVGGMNEREEGKKREKEKGKRENIKELKGEMGKTWGCRKVLF